MKRNIELGGIIETGDLLAISYNNYLQLGFYVENGINGSLKYISVNTIVSTKRYYDRWIDGKMDSNLNYWNNKFKNGLIFKSFAKDYIIQTECRVIKINNPEEVLTGESLSNYLMAKEILIKLNVIKE